MNELNIKDYEIICVGVDSNVSSKPINDETLIGALNRNRNLLEYCHENNIAFDLLISIEGGYEQVLDTYFIVTYATIFDKNGDNFVGKSQGLQISKKMFEWVKSGKSLNKVIELLEGCFENKKDNGISGYLTDSFYKRVSFDSSAIISALITMLNQEKNIKS